MPVTIIKPDKESSVEGKNLAGELHMLMMHSITYRGRCGATFDIQSAYLRTGQDIPWPNSTPWLKIGPIEPPPTSFSEEPSFMSLGTGMIPMFLE